MIVRWGLEELPGLLSELGIERPFLVASLRWSAPVEVAGTWTVPDSDKEYITIPGAVGAYPDEIDHFDVITGDDELLVRIALP